MTVHNTTGTHGMRPTHTQTGFTLIEVLVVILIVVVFAAFILPPITGDATDQARSTQLKSRGRGIWLAIMATKMERETFNKSPLWPPELRLQVDQGGEGRTFTTATEYFKILMAGDRHENQLVPDLNPEILSARGYPTATNATSLKANNIAWHVADVSCSFTNTDAFLISKDVAQVTRSGASNAPVVLSHFGPFGGKRVVWVTRGGGVYDTRKKFVTNWGMFFPSTNNVPFLPD